MSRWTRVARASDVPVGGAKTIKASGAQIALLHLEDGRLCAVDNLCPHEGYPLAQGRVEGCTLTCEWHNWKFRVPGGACERGGEDVRAYPVRVEGGDVWVDLSEPPLSEVRPALYRSLAEAFDEGDFGWAGRQVERLLARGEPASEVLGFGCEWAARRAPDGFDHGLAAAADLAALLELDREEPGRLLLEAFELLVLPNLRRPERSAPAPAPLAAATEEELRRRIEAEDVGGAEAVVAAALDTGDRGREVAGWLARAASDHFLAFGHAEIYAAKAEELLDFIGWERARPILCALTRAIAVGTREDRLPYMRRFGAIFARYRPRLEAWAGRAGSGAPEVDRVISAAVDGDLEAALEAIAGELERGAAPDRVALALGLAAGHRLLRFDPELEHRDDIAEGWLDVTHAITYADAVREGLRRRPGADALRGLFYAARFVQHLAPLDLPASARPPIEGPAPEAEALLARGLRASVLPIFIAHRVKTPCAARRLDRAMAEDPAFRARPDRAVLLRAVSRFLDHPLAERRTARRSYAARLFVREGKRVEELT